MLRLNHKTIIEFVTTSSNKLLHSMLIIMLMLLPLRGAFAMQLVACNMDDTSATMSLEHCQHKAALSASAGSVVKQHASTPYKGCCSNGGACMSDCHFAMSASLLVTDSGYAPVLLATAVIATISNALVVRELSPPSRPPLTLHS